MSKNDWHYEPAFARPVSFSESGEERLGASMWDYFAAAALQGILAAQTFPDSAYRIYRDAAIDASKYADAMMAERAKRAAQAQLDAGAKP